MSPAVRVGCRPLPSVTRSRLSGRCRVSNDRLGAICRRIGETEAENGAKDTAVGGTEGGTRECTEGGTDQPDWTRRRHHSARRRHRNGREDTLTIPVVLVTLCRRSYCANFSALSIPPPLPSWTDPPSPPPPPPPLDASLTECLQHFPLRILIVVGDGSEDVVVLGRQTSLEDGEEEDVRRASLHLRVALRSVSEVTHVVDSAAIVVHSRQLGRALQHADEPELCRVGVRVRRARRLEDALRMRHHDDVGESRALCHRLGAPAVEEEDTGAGEADDCRRHHAA